MNFFRQHRPANAAPKVQQPVRRCENPIAQTDTETYQPWPRLDATFVGIVGFIITAFFISSGTAKLPSEMAHLAAVGVGLTLLASFAFELRSGLKNVVRADLVGILAFYYLTLYEFLFRQPYFDKDMRFLSLTELALYAVITGIAGIMIGRHLAPRGKQPFQAIMTREVPANWIITLFWASFFLGIFHMLLAEGFNISKMFVDMMKPRFNQPWGRGKFGDWKALLNELALLLYFIPPLMGLMLARRERYSAVNFVSAFVGFAFVLFYGFVSGTRSLFGAYLVTFMIAFAFACPAQKRKQTVLIFTICAAAMALSTKAMLEMRSVGFTNWWDGKYKTYVNRQTQSVFVDDNLLAITKIVGFFPEQNGGKYLGFEIPYLAIIRPIPRAIWPGKPAGLSVNLEQSLFQLKGLTISCTFVGEGYMSGGMIAVLIQGVVLGMMAGWWSRLASAQNSELGILIYSSGFFAVVITMRSTFALTTALLTPAAGILAGHFLLKGARKVLARRPPQRPQFRPPQVQRPPSPT